MDASGPGPVGGPARAHHRGFLAAVGTPPPTYAIRTPPLEAAVIRSFSAPDHIYHVGRQTVLVWNHPIDVS